LKRKTLITAKEGRSFGKKGEKNNGKIDDVLLIVTTIVSFQTKKGCLGISSYPLYMDSKTIADVIFATSGRVMSNCLTNIYQNQLQSPQRETFQVVFLCPMNQSTPQPLRLLTPKH